MKIEMVPIGYVETDCEKLPRHWTVSDVEGRLVIDPGYEEGLADITPGKRIVVIFCFHKSPPFEAGLLKQTPPRHDRPKGVFSICTPRRPNPIGLSVVEVLAKTGSTIHVRGIDMIDGTPILDIKPFVTDAQNCPSGTEREE